MGRTLDSFREEMKDETLNQEEDTSTETGESEENELDSEEDTSLNDTETTEEVVEEESDEVIQIKKSEYEKVLRDKENYKQGMLAAKGKKRGDEGLTKESKVSLSDEQTVAKVLAKREEQKALKNTIDPKNPDFIPELVDDNQYQEIIGYLPLNVDKTSYESIVEGLKDATELWKKKKGILNKQPKKDTGLQNSKSSVSSQKQVKEDAGAKFRTRTSSYLDWYKKN